MNIKFDKLSQSNRVQFFFYYLSRQELRKLPAQRVLACPRNSYECHRLIAWTQQTSVGWGEGQEVSLVAAVTTSFIWSVNSRSGDDRVTGEEGEVNPHMW